MDQFEPFLTQCFSCSYSSLLPYLPMLMDPLVSALNGSQTLVSQVLGTCIVRRTWCKGGTYSEYSKKKYNRLQTNY